jgi:LuxR family maltose regulon positive regulatory protein
MEQALASARALGSPLSIAEVEARRAGLWLAQGDLAAALGWLAGRTLDLDDQAPYENQFEYVMLARIRIAQEWQTPGSGDLGAVVRLLDRLLQAAQADERAIDQILLLALLALAHAAGGNPDQALASLAPALALAEPEGYVRIFVDEGARMRSLLVLQHAQVPNTKDWARLRSYIDRLLGAFSSAAEAAPASVAAPSPLSERERTILQLIADGRSIQEMAGILIISAHTARTHVKHVYAKLDAHNRVQALERARALQLL